MGAMTSVRALVVLAAATPAEARSIGDPVARWHPIVVEASAQFGVPTSWIERVIRAESGGLTTLAGKPIRSRAGAIGLMQIMPATWTTIRATYRLGDDPDDPHDNIIAGTAFLRLMFDRVGYPGLFAAYNAGPARYAAYLAGRSPLPPETVAYLGGLTGNRSTAPTTASAPSREPLFALRHDLAEPQRPTSDQAAGGGLFAVRKGTS